MATASSYMTPTPDPTWGATLNPQEDQGLSVVQDQDQDQKEETLSQLTQITLEAILLISQKYKIQIFQINSVECFIWVCSANTVKNATASIHFL